MLAEGSTFKLCLATKFVLKPTSEPAGEEEADAAAHAESPAEPERCDAGEFDLLRAIDTIAAKAGGRPDVEWLLADLAKLKLDAAATGLADGEGGGPLLAARPSAVSRDELDEENLRWLTSEYTRERKESALAHSPSTVNAHEFYYLDNTQAENGPFTATVMRAWLDAGFMHSQVLIRQGTTGGFRPLDTHSALVQQQQDVSSLEWPKLSDAQHASVMDWDFNIWELSKMQLPLLAGSILMELDIPSSFEVCH